MSEVKESQNIVSMIDELNKEHIHFIVQRDLAQQNLNQYIGAIYACETMIKKFEEQKAKKELAQGDNKDGEVNYESTGEVA